MSDIRLIHGDCLEVMPALADKSIDAIITDPPYPDYHIEKYGLVDIKFLLSYPCRQFIFWTSKVDFPLDYTAIHIWDKRTGAGSEYERIFERNGQGNYKVFRYYLINSTVAASYAQDEFTGHPSQKPIQLMRRLIRDYTKPGDTILDPFMGSGSTMKACYLEGRNGIGIELDEGYYHIAEKRIKEAQLQIRMEL